MLAMRSSAAPGVGGPVLVPAGRFRGHWRLQRELVSVEDLDFAKRLKAHGKKQGKRFKTITRAHIVTSCRKFDTFGDWYLVLNPGLCGGFFTGKSQKDADDFYYDVER